MNAFAAIIASFISSKMLRFVCSVGCVRSLAFSMRTISSAADELFGNIQRIDLTRCQFLVEAFQKIE